MPGIACRTTIKPDGPIMVTTIGNIEVIPVPLQS